VEINDRDWGPDGKLLLHRLMVQVDLVVASVWVMRAETYKTPPIYQICRRQKEQALSNLIRAARGVIMPIAVSLSVPAEDRPLAELLKAALASKTKLDTHQASSSIHLRREPDFFQAAWESLAPTLLQHSDELVRDHGFRPHSSASTLP
jgi:hypothetical protein